MRAIGIPLILTGIIILLLMRWKLGPVLLAGARIVLCSQNNESKATSQLFSNVPSNFWSARSG
ncbi:MAG: hypothetical protein WA737_16080 [Candidatus Acidiferrales bacterium]